jgi:hypothetical protein
MILLYQGGLKFRNLALHHETDSQRKRGESAREHFFQLDLCLSVMKYTSRLIVPSRETGRMGFSTKMTTK